MESHITFDTAKLAKENIIWMEIEYLNYFQN